MSDEKQKRQKKYFGTDGIRGQVNGPIINVEIVTKLGFAIAAVTKENAQIKSEKKLLAVIGRDTRESGEPLEAALQSGLLRSGVDVISLGVLPTPAIAFMTQFLKADVGVVISASHNPYTDNGIKIIGPNGSKLPDAWELQIEQKIEETPVPVDKKTEGILHDNQGLYAHYIDHCLQLFQPAVSFDDIKLVIDCANGATAEIAPMLFSKLPMHCTVIHATPDGKNINAQCGATNVKSLQSHVLKNKAACGVAFDGDGDRLIMVDHLGEIVDGDEILGILAVDPARKKNPNEAIVGTVMSNLGLEKAIQSHGLQFERAAVGDRYVLEKLRGNGWRLGGEASGHIINLEYAATGDGILTALQVLRIMHQTKKSLHDLKKGVQKQPHILINVPVTDIAGFASMTKIHSAVDEAQKIVGDSGRILLRASGTESCIRVMVECNDAAQAHVIAVGLAKVVEMCFSVSRV